MGVAMDTIGLTATQAATPANPLQLAAVGGDSLTVRNYAVTDKAWLEAIGLNFATAASGDNFQLTSPMLHDDVSGINFQTAGNPAAFLMPREVGQLLTPGDTLAAEVTDGTASDVATASLHAYYANLPGASARLASWSDISGNIRYLKQVRVAVTPVAGAWVDTLLGTNADVLHSKADYAVLGYVADANATAIGVKGQFTSNLRACGPGVDSTLSISDYFVAMADKMKMPHIPVFNADDRLAVYVSLLAAATGTVNVTLNLAELSTPFPK